MKQRRIYPMVLPAMLASTISLGAQAQDSVMDGLNKAVKEGSVKLDFRYRYEHVDQDGFDKEANASTLRSRLTLASGTVWGLSALAEIDNISNIGNDLYNSTENGKVQYPVVADPKGTDINQVWLKYSWEDLSGTYGRQRILHGSQRFVGGVGWRQNEQTYDGFRALWKSDNGLSLDYAYVYNINRIFGPDDGVPQPADWHGENHLFRMDWKFLENHTVTGFYYGLEIDQRGNWPIVETDWHPNKSVNNSTDTYGIEYSGKLGPVAAKAAWATQSDAGDSYLDYDADYWMLEGAMTVGGVTGKVGYEVLGGDDGVGFKTPLATLHKFQGWADKFLTTPGDGIEDFYLGASGKLGPVKLAAYYHDFQAEDSSEDWGTEWDLVATWPINKQFTTQLKYANFDGDHPSFADTEKLWLTLQLKL
jgi:hypothetical protein